MQVPSKVLAAQAEAQVRSRDVTPSCMQATWPDSTHVLEAQAERAERLAEERQRAEQEKAARAREEAATLRAAREGEAAVAAQEAAARRGTLEGLSKAASELEKLLIKART